MNIDTSPTKDDWAYACSCGSVSRDPKEGEVYARKALYDHWDHHCPEENAQGVLLRLDDPRWRAAWAKARLLKEGGLTANSGLQESEESCAPITVTREGQA